MVTTFTIGFCVVGMELVSSRLLAPAFGTSIFVWSSIIGIVLLGLSVGYYFGGMLADKKPHLSVLTGLVLAAGAYFLFIPTLNEVIVNFTNSIIYSNFQSEIGFYLSVFAAGLIIFGLPIILLGMTSPMIVKMYSMQTNAVGESAGVVFAVSTVGSILGTILPTLLFMPKFGTRNTIFGFAVILIVLGLVNFSLKKVIAVILVVAASYSASFLPANKFPYKVLAQTESLYHHIKVVEDDSQNRYLVFNEALSAESVYKPNSILTGSFYDYYSFLPYKFLASAKPVKVLLLGVAGATIPRQYNHFFGDQVEIDAVEIDKKVIEVAREYFDLDALRLNLIIEDGRKFLSETKNKYDIIIVDVFQNELYIPWTFTTQEFWKLAKERLTNAGLVAINVHSSNNKTDLLKYIANTQAFVFNHVYFSDFKKGLGFSYMITASQQPVSFEFSQYNGALKGLYTDLKNTSEVEFNPKEKILTDDWSPIEQLFEHSVSVYRKQKALR